MKHAKKQIIKITLYDDFADSYNYLVKLGVVPQNIVKDIINKEVYEKAREYRFKIRHRNDEAPF